jgi:hypothetical protein
VRSIFHRDFVYQPWSDERRLAASAAAKTRISDKQRVARIEEAIEAAQFFASLGYLYIEHDADHIYNMAELAICTDRSKLFNYATQMTAIRGIDAGGEGDHG